MWFLIAAYLQKQQQSEGKCAECQRHRPNKIYYITIITLFTGVQEIGHPGYELQRITLIKYMIPCNKFMSMENMLV